MPLYLIRHAHTPWNGPPRRFQGQTDTSISESGRAAARALGPRLPRPDRVVSSPARRCRETIEAAFNPVPPLTTDPRLWEMHYGWWEGLVDQDIQQRFPDQWEQWRRDPLSVRPGDGEGLAAVRDRVVAAMEDVIDSLRPDENVYVCTHGGCLRATLCHFNDIPMADWRSLKVPNLVVLRWTDTGRFEILETDADGNAA